MNIFCTSGIGDSSEILGSLSSPSPLRKTNQSSEGVQEERLAIPTSIQAHPSSLRIDFSHFSPRDPILAPASATHGGFEAGGWSSCSEVPPEPLPHQDLCTAQQEEFEAIFNLGSRLAAKHGASAGAGLCVPGNSEHSCFSTGPGCYFSTLLWARVEKQEE